MAKRKPEDAGPPAKRGGFRGMDCPFSKADFLAHAADTTMTLELLPKTFGPGGYGYQRGGGIAKVEADGPDSHALGDKIAYVRPSCLAKVVGSKCAQGHGVLAADEFMKTATPLNVTLQIAPVEFSTGSFGWIANRRQNETVAGKELTLQVNFNASVNGSKDKSEAEEDPVTASIDPDAIKQYLPTIGESSEQRRQYLTKIRGVGPWVEKRLHRIGIFTFRQLAKMTPEIEDAVNAAVKYFPGRVKRDEWVLQAQKLAGGKWDDANLLAGRATGKAVIDEEEDERMLVDVANHAAEDGALD